MKLTRAIESDPAALEPSPIGAERQPDHNEFAARLCNLPPLNAIANQLLSLSADPEASIEQLSSVMQSDPALTADVLLLANSPLFGLRKIQVIRHAITLLGIDRIKTVAFTAAMRAFVGAGGGSFLRPCWLHSVASAIIAEEIAPRLSVTRDVAYPLVLMHDIGRLGLLKSNEKEYSRLLSERYANPDELLAAERGAFKMDHAFAGSLLVKTWGYPSSFNQICEHHHDPYQDGDNELLLVAKLSCRMAETLGFAAVSYTQAPAYTDLIQSLPRAVEGKSFPAGADMAACVESRIKGFV